MTTDTMADMTVRPLPVVAQGPARVADEAVDVARSAGSTCVDDGLPEPGAVLEQVVHDQRAEDDAAGQGDERADARRPGR